MKGGFGDWITGYEESRPRKEVKGYIKYNGSIYPWSGGEDPMKGESAISFKLAAQSLGIEKYEIRQASDGTIWRF